MTVHSSERRKPETNMSRLDANNLARQVQAISNRMYGNTDIQYCARERDHRRILELLPFSRAPHRRTFGPYLAGSKKQERQSSGRS